LSRLFAKNMTRFYLHFLANLL